MKNNKDQIHPETWMKEHSTGVIPWTVQKTLKSDQGLCYTFMTFHEIWPWSEKTTITDFSLS